MVKISKIEWSNRKTVSISLSQIGELIVKAPTGCPKSKIDEFINSKQAWIENKLKKLKFVQDKYRDIMTYEKLLILGVSYNGYSSQKVKKISLVDNKALIPVSITPDKLHKKITSWYKKYADEVLIPRTIEIGKLAGLTPTNIKCTGSRGRWGACNSKGELFLNWRCIMLPPYLIDYVIVHELAHLLELNHSSKFWNIVQKLLPDYKVRRNKIKEFGFCLKLF